MNIMRTITVTIGRNILDQPMLPARWQQFQDDVADMLEVHAARDSSWIETHYGTGEWDGVTEDSARITILDVVDAPMREIVETLENLASDYGQDAIALATGESFLVERKALQHSSSPVTV